MAAEIIENRADAGVVSSYVADFGGFDLLGGAAQFKEVGRTRPIPFMTFALSTRRDGARRDAIRSVLLEMTGQNVPEKLYSTGFTAPAPWIPGETEP